MDLYLPLAILDTPLDFFLFVMLADRVWESRESVAIIGLSNTVRAARSMLGFCIKDSMSLPTDFLGDSGVKSGLL